jgi:hypothetical protein
MLDRLVFDTTEPDFSANVGAYLRSSDGTLLTHTTVGGKEALDVNIASPLELDVLIEAEKAEDSAHVSGDIGNFVLAVRDDGVQASATVGPNVFTAVNFGTGGNSISLVFDGIDDVATVVAAWNSTNPSNTVSYTGSGATVPSAQTVNLINGAANTVLTSDNYDYSAFAVDKFGQLRVRDDAVLAKLNSSIVVTATDLDIRDLSFASDSVDVSGSSVSITGDVNVTQGTSPWVIGDGGGSITVDASDLDIRDLVAATDSVSSWTKDGSGVSITSTVNGGDTGLDVNLINTSLTVSDAALANVAIMTGANLLGTINTAEDIVASPLANRKYLFVRNDNNKPIYIGPSGVTAANGWPLFPGSELHLRAGASIDIEWVSDNVTHAIKYLELS